MAEEAKSKNSNRKENGSEEKCDSESASSKQSKDSKESEKGDDGDIKNSPEKGQVRKQKFCTKEEFVCSFNVCAFSSISRMCVSWNVSKTFFTRTKRN